MTLKYPNLPIPRNQPNSTNFLSPGVARKEPCTPGALARFFEAPLFSCWLDRQGMRNGMTPSKTPFRFIPNTSGHSQQHRPVLRHTRQKALQTPAHVIFSRGRPLLRIHCVETDVRPERGTACIGGSSNKIVFVGTPSECPFLLDAPNPSNLSALVLQRCSSL